MISFIRSLGLMGIEARKIRIEADLSPGLPRTTIVGLPDKAVSESKERIFSAIKNSGFEYPIKRVTINLSPGDIKKEGALYDLPIALAVLSAAEEIEGAADANFYIVGELSLDGLVRRANGILAMAMEVSKTGGAFIVPLDNAQEAALAKNVRVYPVRTLYEAVKVLKGENEPLENKPNDLINITNSCTYDFSDIKGQQSAKRAMEIAAAGNHNILTIGPPGSGKTMLARRLPSILPPLSFEEALEVTKIYSLKGLLKEPGIITERPFRSPHHSISYAGLIGGGAVPGPGEISLAHRGVLFLDELTEFGRNTLEMLRQPMEDDEVLISRAKQSITYPASFMLAAAMNPCPCGFLGDSRNKCDCSPYAVNKYVSKISGPILDRIDIQIEVSRLQVAEFTDLKDEESSRSIRERVIRCREFQKQRMKNRPVISNSNLPEPLLKETCKTNAKAKKLILKIMENSGFTARTFSKILRTARTIADLEEKEIVEEHHIAEAAQYRNIDRTKLKLL